MKSTTYLLVGVLVAIAIIAIIKKHFFEVADYDLLTQGNALRFGIEGYEDAEASETKAEDDAETEADDEVYEGYEDDEEDDVEHMTTAAKAKRDMKKVKAKLRAAAKKLKAKKKAPAAKAPETAPETATAPATAPATPEKFENTPRFQELKAKWDAYKATKGPALSEEERNELLALLDMPDEPVKEESFEQFEEMPYQGTEYAMF